jgi:hypothetical protein
MPKDIDLRLATLDLLTAASRGCRGEERVEFVPAHSKAIGGHEDRLDLMAQCTENKAILVSFQESFAEVVFFGGLDHWKTEYEPRIALVA